MYFQTHFDQLQCFVDQAYKDFIHFTLKKALIGNKSKIIFYALVLVEFRLIKCFHSDFLEILVS
jgi:hypothetical protein